MDTTSLILGLFFGSVGFAYCVYAKKRSDFAIFIAGLLLMGLPYLIENNFALVAISLIVMVAPKFIKL